MTYKIAKQGKVMCIMMKLSRRGNYGVDSSDNQVIEDEDYVLPKVNSNGLCYILGTV